EKATFRARMPSSAAVSQLPVGSCKMAFAAANRNDSICGMAALTFWATADSVTTLPLNGRFSSLQLHLNSQFKVQAGLKTFAPGNHYRAQVGDLPLAHMALKLGSKANEIKAQYVSHVNQSNLIGCISGYFTSGSGPKRVEVSTTAPRMTNMRLAPE